MVSMKNDLLETQSLKITASRKISLKRGLISYSEGQQLNAVLYLIFTVCSASDPSGQTRVNYRNAAQLYKQGWIA